MACATVAARLTAPLASRGRAAQPLGAAAANRRPARRLVVAASQDAQSGPTAKEWRQIKAHAAKLEATITQAEKRMQEMQLLPPRSATACDLGAGPTAAPLASHGHAAQLQDAAGTYVPAQRQGVMGASLWGKIGMQAAAKAFGGSVAGVATALLTRVWEDIMQQGGPTPEEWQEMKAKIAQLRARDAQLQKNALLLADSLGQMSGGMGGQSDACEEAEDWRAC